MILRIVQTKDTLSEIYVDALRIRSEVFMKEQGVPVTIEVDEHEAYCIHFVYYDDDNKALGTCRLLPLSEGNIKLQRMAVLKPYRQQKIGLELMLEAERFAKRHGFKEMTLGAQLTALPFYAKLGYKPQGTVFEEANMPHQQMTKAL